MKRFIASLLAVCMLLALLPAMSVFADATDVGTHVANKAYAQYKNDGIYRDYTASQSIERYNYKPMYYIFNDIDEGAVLSNLKFIVGQTGGSDQIHSVDYAVIDTPVWNEAEIAAVKFTGEGTGNIGTNKCTVGTYAGEDTAITNTGYYEYDFSGITLAAGQTLVLRRSGGANNQYLAAPAATTYVKPQLTFTYDKTAFEADVLAAVNGAETAEELVTVLKTYNKTIGLNETDISIYTVRAAEDALLSQSFTAFADIKTALETVVDERYQTTTVIADKAMRYRTAWTLNTDSGERYSAYNYYIFNNIENASKFKDITFRVGTNTGTDQNNKNITYLLYDGTINTIEEMAALITTPSSALRNSIGADINFRKTGAETLYGTSQDVYYEVPLSSYMSIPDGYTLILRFQNADATRLGGTNSTAYVRPQISYSYDKATIDSAALDAVNDATTPAQLEAAINAYGKTIGVEKSLMNEYTVDAYTAALVTNKPSGGFADLAAIKTAYDAAVSDEFILGKVDAATADTIADVLGAFADSLGLSGKEADITKYAAVLPAGLDAVGIAEATEISFVATNFDAAVEKGIAAAVSGAATEAELRVLLTTYATEIGIDKWEMSDAKAAALFAGFSGKTFASYAEIEAEFYTSLSEIILEGSLVADFAAVESWHTADGGTGSFNADTNIWYESTASAEANKNYRRPYYVFNNITNVDLINDLKFIVGTRDGMQLKVLKYSIVDTAVTTVDGVKALTYSGSISPTNKSAEDGKTYQEFDLSSITLTEGQTLVVRTENSGSDIVAMPGATSLIKPQLVYMYDKELVATPELTIDATFSEDEANVTASLTMSNTTTEDQGYILIMASYVGGVLKDCAISDAATLAKTNGSATPTISVAKTDGAEYKLFVWDGRTYLKPLFAKSK